MSISSNIRKVLFISFWVTMGAGILVLLIAAMRVKKEEVCSGYSIEIKSPSEELFIDKKDVENIITSNGTFVLNGKPIKSFDLRKMELQLLKNVWVSNAELYFDNSNELKIKIKERQPVARVFTSLGNSFYIDSSCIKLPLSDKFSARLPVFTGFPSNAEKLSAADKDLLNQVKDLSAYISANEFWMALIAQVDINSNRQFEFIPIVGNQVIEFGDATDADKKFRRLMIFYKKIVSQSGFNVYERIKAQYANQIVGVRNSVPISKYDSLQAIKNVQKLIEMAQTEQARMLKMDSLNVVEHRSDNQFNGKPTDSVVQGRDLIPGDSTVRVDTARTIRRR